MLSCGSTGATPLLIGVTGSIAAGKSFLCKRLVSVHGARHLDADLEIHRLYQPGTAAHGRIVAHFGAGVAGADGAIDRKALGAKVFDNPAEMQALRAAIGDLPAHFMGLLRDWRAEMPADGLGVFEAVNLFDNEYMTLCDTAWLVVCEPATAIRRLVEQRGHSPEEAAQRLAAARPWAAQAPLADHVFHNDGSPEAFAAAIDGKLAALRARHRAGTMPPTAWSRARGS